MATKTKTTKRYRPNDGWLSVKLPHDTSAKLREIAAKTGLKLTTIVTQGIEHQHAEWKAAGFRVMASQPQKEERL